MALAITIIHIVACFFLIVVVLLQTGKGADIGAVFGGSSQTIFGSGGAGNLLTKLTTWTAVIFMFTSIFLTWWSTKSLTLSVADDAVLPSEPPPLVAPAQDNPIPAPPADATAPAGEPAAGADSAAPAAESEAKADAAIAPAVPAPPADASPVDAKPAAPPAEGAAAKPESAPAAP
ncbi:MAG: preprotein translocase subunit SecG [Deltaproteobacteria bacterium]|nr:preprotein translocase subunit SecG [Deltaproteobacteria bacterium]